MITLELQNKLKSKYNALRFCLDSKSSFVRTGTVWETRSRERNRHKKANKTRTRTKSSKSIEGAHTSNKNIVIRPKREQNCIKSEAHDLTRVTENTNIRYIIPKEDTVLERDKNKYFNGLRIRPRAVLTR